MYIPNRLSITGAKILRYFDAKNELFEFYFLSDERINDFLVKSEFQCEELNFDTPSDCYIYNFLLSLHQLSDDTIGYGGLYRST